MSDLSASGSPCGVDVCYWASGDSGVNTGEMLAIEDDSFVNTETYITVVIDWAGTLEVIGEVAELEAELDAGIELDA